MNANKLFPYLICSVMLLAACQSAAEPETVVETVVVTEVVERESAQTVVEAGESVSPSEPLPTSGPFSEGYGGEETIVVPDKPDRVTEYEPVTAGVVDDNEAWETFLNYLARHKQLYVHHRDVSERYAIHVRDHAGQGVHDADVYVYRGDALAFQGRTDAGGRVLFHPRALDSQPQGGRFRVLAFKGQVSGQAEFERFAQPEWVVTLPEAPLASQTRLDLLFLMDATGSMGDEIGKLKATMGDIADQIARLPEQPDVRYGLVAYRDRGDSFIVRSSDFTGNLRGFQDELARLNAGGGGDYPESVNEALHTSIHSLSWREQDTVRIILLVADAPPHLDYGEPYSYATDMVDAVRKGIKIFPIGASGLDSQGEYIFRQLAQFTGGKFVFLTYAEGADPSSGPGGETTHDVEGYSVETLDRLVVRLVKEELAKLPELASAQQVVSVQGSSSQGVSNPGQNPDNPVWFIPSPGSPAVEPKPWYINGDFANGLDGWEVIHGSNVADIWDVELIAYQGDFQDVVAFVRADSGTDGGTVGIVQHLDMGVSGMRELRIQSDLMVQEHSLGSSGWWCDQHGCAGEYPLRIDIIYQADNGATYQWVWGFLTQTNSAQLRNYTRVPKGDWYHFESPNLRQLDPRPVALKSIQISGAGWDFRSQVDHVSLVVVP